jgi:hypothetical protein
METIDGIVWSRSFVVVDTAMPLGAALDQIRSTQVRWIVIRRQNGLYLYAFRPDELLWWPPLRAAFESSTADMGAPLEHALFLHEEHSSTQTTNRSAPPPIDRAWRASVQAPSIDRYVEVDAGGMPQAIGEKVPTTRGINDDLERQERLRSDLKEEATGSIDRAWSLSLGTIRRDLQAAEPPPAAATPPPAAAAPLPGISTSRFPFTPTVEDEGTTPIRHPSIDVDRPLQPGVEIGITVDLIFKAVQHTQGDPVNVGPLASDWTSLELTVLLQCPALDFAATQSTVTIRRNAASLPAMFKATVRDDAHGTIAIMATFVLGTRFSGSAVRIFNVGTVAHSPHVSGSSNGIVAVEPKAAQPDLTVHISKIDRDSPGRLRWLVVTARFDGLPAKLEEDIDLGKDPAGEASALFREFAVLVRGQHTQRIDGFGSRLWTLAPSMFRTVYWALWDRYERPLTIQFISDEPHMPWELMRPARADESEIHPPLALKHPVARWIKRWDGYMRNQVPAGRIFTIAPTYPSASRALKRAQTESNMLVTHFAAHKEDGTRAAVLRLLETTSPAEPVSILHFAGHGKFAPEAATDSNIELEDGELAAAEVDRPEVKLGQMCRTLVFFNACEVGAAGAVFGEVGGWADAFLGRQFGGFIAPLWSVDDEDAGEVAVELLNSIVKEHQPIGAALRAVREVHGATSPTFYSYLFYGDVTAQIGA